MRPRYRFLLTTMVLSLVASGLFSSPAAAAAPPGGFGAVLAAQQPSTALAPARSASTTAPAPARSASASAQAATAAAIPQYDHVVVVIMENHSADNIIANPAAPYINSLAASGASMTQSFGVTHPSQPNYIALFSGSQQGIIDNSCPNTFSSDNLGAQLIAAGKTFVGYSETMPSAGYNGCTSGAYARKHNPWVDFSNVPAASNQPLTSLPASWAALPTVSIVVPNLLNDMHDGTIGQADSWLQNRFDGYLQWAKQHNSLLIVTWDEDDNNSSNRIPTIFAGAGVRPGQYPQLINHYNMLRTLQDMYGLPPLANSATAGPIVDVWDAAPANLPPVASFTGSCAQLVCSVNGTASADPDGSVASYTWDWGDGATSSSSTASHTFQAAGTKTVTLMVTDNLGRTNSTSRQLTATGPAGSQPFVVDSFARTMLTGWGTADVGGAWTVSSAGNSSVGGGLGSLRLAAGQTITATLPSVSSSDSDLRTTFSVDKLPSGNGIYLGLIGRRVGTNLEYGARVMVRSDGQLGLLLTSLAGSATMVTLKPQVIVPGVGTANAVPVRARLQVTGRSPTTIRAKLWPASGVEPVAWQLSATDSFTALQAPGSVGLSPYLSSSSTVSPVTVRFADLSARPANQSPVAAFTASCSVLTCAVDASGSSDPDGTVSSYAWNWGDGSGGTGATASHRYAVAGTYQVTLTVTDNAGAASTVSHSVNPVAPANVPPNAAFTSACSLLNCSFDSATANDPDGTLAGFAWDFGDGGSGTGASSQHSYQAAGTYTVRLTVTDNLGATGTITHPVVVTAPAGSPPVADFTVGCQLLTCSADGTASSDPDGSIASYRWDWGDGSIGTGATSSHTYLNAGSYPVLLTATDDSGATNSTTRTVVATAPVNQPPTAVAAGSCAFLTCAVDAAGSSDSDGSIASYSWAWGDGTSAGTGPTSSHVYAAAGTRTVTLTVTDQQGGKGSTTLTLTPTSPPVTGPFAADAFARTVSAGWGTADKGGPWTTAGNATKYTVGGGVGSMTAKTGETDSAMLQTVSSTDSDLTVTLSTDKLTSGSGTYVTVIGRRVGTNLEYQTRLKVLPSGSVAMMLGALQGSATVTTLKPEVTPTGLTFAGASTVAVRFQVTGTAPTTVRVKAWKAGTAEPTGWQLTTTDGYPALQAPGSVGLQTYLSSSSTITPVTLKASAFSVKPAAG
ncbi:MAG: PKD domain-containing protein [Nakamurella sp.]